MQFLSIFARLLVMALIVSACGTPAAPTAEPADIQATVAAAALTVIAETQAAIPTATPPPPTATTTDTPPPTETFLPLPTSDAAFTPVPNATSDDPCIYQVMPAPLQGETVRMRIHNSTRVTVSVTVYLNQAGPGSQCGYRSYTLASQDFVVINDLIVGCYTLWAWNPDPDAYFIVTNGTSCLDSSNRWVFDISTSSIKLGT